VFELAKGFQNERYRLLIVELIRARKARGLSQTDMAARLRSHQQFVSRYETGERRLDIVEFVDVARALGLNPAELIGSC
jgi:transcriptional regulator with XRE-family HTH domain